MKDPGYLLLVMLAFCFLYGGMTVGQLKRDVHHLQMEVEMLESRERDRYAEKAAAFEPNFYGIGLALREPMTRLNGEYGRVHIGWVECPGGMQ